MPLFSAEKIRALQCLREEGLIDRGLWIYFIIDAVVQHQNSLSMAEALILLNSIFSQRMVFNAHDSPEGFYLHKLLHRLSYSSDPYAMIQFIYNQDRNVALRSAEISGILRRHNFSSFIVAMLLEHKKPRELCAAFILTNRTFNNKLLNSNNSIKHKKFVHSHLINIYKDDKPFKIAAAFDQLVRLFRYRYKFAIGDLDAAEDMTIFFKINANKNLCYSVMNGSQLIADETIDFPAPENLDLAFLEDNREAIMAQISMNGHIKHYFEEWYRYFKKELLAHSNPFVLALMLSKFNDTNFWEDESQIKLLVHICKFCSSWLMYQDFFRMFMQLQQQVLSAEIKLIILEKQIDGESFLSREFIESLCLKMTERLGVQVELAAENQPKTYLNLLIQKAELTKRYPAASSSLFDVNDYELEEYFEQPGCNNFL